MMSQRNPLKTMLRTQRGKKAAALITPGHLKTDTCPPGMRRHIYRVTKTADPQAGTEAGDKLGVKVTFFTDLMIKVGNSQFQSALRSQTGQQMEQHDRINTAGNPDKYPAPRSGKR